MSEIELVTNPELPAKRPVGRPRKADKYAGQIAAAEDRIADQLPNIIDNMLALAAGVLVEGFDPNTGAKVVYKTIPCIKANQYLANRIMGMVTKQVETEISGELTVKPSLSDFQDAIRERRKPH